MPLSIFNMRTTKLLSTLLLILAFNTSCMHRETHQGNVFKTDSIWLISKGDTKFEVENAYGSPSIIDVLHPNRVHYVEEVKDAKDGHDFTRSIIIEYDQALRVKSIQRLGFDNE